MEKHGSEGKSENIPGYESNSCRYSCRYLPRYSSVYKSNSSSSSMPSYEEWQQLYESETTKAFNKIAPYLEIPQQILYSYIRAKIRNDLNICKISEEEIQILSHEMNNSYRYMENFHNSDIFRTLEDAEKLLANRLQNIITEKFQKKPEKPKNKPRNGSEISISEKPKGISDISEISISEKPEGTSDTSDISDTSAAPEISTTEKPKNKDDEDKTEYNIERTPDDHDDEEEDDDKNEDQNQDETSNIEQIINNLEVDTINDSSGLQTFHNRLHSKLSFAFKQIKCMVREIQGDKSCCQLCYNLNLPNR